MKDDVKRRKNNVDGKVNCKLILEVLAKNKNPLTSSEITNKINKKITSGQIVYKKLDYKTSLRSLVYGHLNNLVRSKKIERLKNEKPYRFRIIGENRKKKKRKKNMNKPVAVVPELKPKPDEVVIIPKIEPDSFILFLESKEDKKSNEATKEFANKLIFDEKEENQYDFLFKDEKNEYDFVFDDEKKGENQYDFLFNDEKKGENQYDFVFDDDFDYDELPDPFIFKIEEECIF